MNPSTSASTPIEQLFPLSDPQSVPASSSTFPDGGQYRVEIPSVEGPEAYRVVLDAARLHGVTVHRVSQGSGIMMLTDAELDEMIDLGTESGQEVCLFVGPRGGWDIGGQVRASSGSLLAGALRGADQLGFGIDDVRRACDRGLRSVLVADLGAIWALGLLRASGDLPQDLVIKSSALLAVANPASARVLEDLGASTLNVPCDLSVAQLAAIRAAVDLPIDLYIEGPDDLGGMVRTYEAAEIVRAAAPVYLKFGLRNAPSIYPSGEHLKGLVLSSAAERVRRCALGMELLARRAPELQMSPAPTGRS